MLNGLTSLDDPATNVTCQRGIVVICSSRTENRTSVIVAVRDNTISLIKMNVRENFWSTNLRIR